MTDTNVRLQNLRDFTVQIRNADDQIVGTGIAVSTDGKIVTCAHVIQAAGINPRHSNSAEVSVYFPQLRGGEEKNRRATVVKYFEDYEDDVVLLQLTNGLSPLAPEQIAVLGTAEESQDHLFRSYGYRDLQEYSGGWADGVINGSVERPPNRKLQSDPIQITSSQINGGMSGSAVLDKERNLIVGIISETWIPDSTTKDRDTGWAVDSYVLSLAPLGLPVQKSPLALKAAPEPKTDEQTKQQVAQVAQVTVEQRTTEEKYSWNNAPAVLKEWTGRDHLLKQITADWNDPTKHVTGLIGFGGEGKSSLARKWVDNLLNDSSQPQPDGVFWWGFYENRNVDEFLEATLKYMSGGRIDPRAVPFSNLRAQIIGAMLGTGRYLFVLDGLEVMQYQEGDQYGIMQSNDLRDLLTFFARPDNQSFCLITSRAPLLDLMEYTTYTHRDVERLSEDDGRALLRRLGVKGSDAEFNKVVKDWDGHALTLSILAAYLAERYEGDIRHLADIPVPTADEPRYERVHRVLRRYDKHLTKEEREFLKLFSVFRLPVKEDALETVFESLLKKKGIATRLFGSKTNSRISNIVKRLVAYRLIRHDEHEKAYITHPLIRNHYFSLFTKGEPSQGKTAHAQIKEYYLSIAGHIPQFPTLDDLKPLIEVVYHACQAGAFDEAFNIYTSRIQQRPNKFVLNQILGSYDTDMNLLTNFFLNGNTSIDSLIGDIRDKQWMLNQIGWCLMSLGRLGDAVPFYERSVKLNIDAQDWGNASQNYVNLSDVHAYLGVLESSAASAYQAVDLARRGENKFRESQSLSNQARAAHLQGKIEANEIFKQAEKVEIERHNKQVDYLYSNRGIFHADSLRRTNQVDYARRVTEANLNISEREHWAYIVSQCRRVLGDLGSDTADHTSARENYDTALKIARGISVHHTLIEALLARGSWQAKYMKDADAAFSDLNEALGYCVKSGYRIYEAGVRVALAWAYLASGENEKAKQSAERALQMSNEMGYYWGRVDAEEVLEKLENRDQGIGNRVLQ